ncbi:uncharacterized protein CDAR_226221 [Caerostris darwini]|uniref:Uncharacterized protein n=1 Tax=Caerostris darwini TaxID=1538125 RepID=A0AAV4ULH1_9ARAC|nr:uncharacterized protein CDAR_226221 [Caerostris darwini]
MEIRWTFALTALLGVILSTSLTGVHSQGIMGGFKGHNRGTGAVELLLATGILAKLLNFRNKHGPNAGRHLLHALIGPRYPANHRYPLEVQPAASHHLLQDDLLEQQASMSSFALNDADLMLNQESALLATRTPFLMSPSMLSDSTSLSIAEAQLSQQLLAARKARKFLEAKKLLEAKNLLAAQEASTLLAAQSEAAHYLASHDALQTQALLADQSRQVYTSLPPPKSIPQRQQNPVQQINFNGNSGLGQSGFVGSNIPPQYQGNQGQQNSANQNSYHGNSNNQIHFQGNSGLQDNNFQSNSIPQVNYHSNSVPQNNYQGNSGMQFNGNQGNNGMQFNGNQGQSDMVASGSETSSHYHPMQQYRQNNYGRQGHYRGNSNPRMRNFMSPEEARQLQASVARADDVLTIPAHFDDEDAAQIIAGLN